MSYYLFISSFHQHVQHMTSQILLILIDFDRAFDHFLIQNYASLNRYNSGTIFLTFAALSYSAIKKHLICTLRQRSNLGITVVAMKPSYHSNKACG